MTVWRICLVFLPLSFLLAQQNGEISISVDSTLVEIPVTVTDSMSRFVLGLEKKDFGILEDGAEQKIANLSGEDAPLSVGLLLDTSGSMIANMSIARAAVDEFIKTMIPGDEAFLIEFSDEAKVTQPFTGKGKDIQNRMGSMKSGGLTALLDAVGLGVREMKKAKNTRKALIVISDGGDNHSRYTATELRDLVKEADTQVYAMGVFEPVLLPGLPGELVTGPRLMGQIADQTGGRAYGATTLAQLPSIAEKIAIELHNQYVLGYYPVNKDKDGKYRKVEVKIQAPAGMSTLKARWRTGYYAPAR
ncbi:MAG TPA: VWA domain-containing protein [Bryobacteraceae bacterium]|jgi:Ca-activated chloride channel family protein|nr:VWA domain-containing protein [Bryobacteraceae bacterium]